MPLKPFQPPSWDAARGPWVRHFKDRHNAALISRKRSIVSSLAEFGRPPWQHTAHSRRARLCWTLSDRRAAAICAGERAHWRFTNDSFQRRINNL